MKMPVPQKAGPGQESVWDYPRPAVAEASGRTLAIEFAGAEIARTSRGARVLETSHPPTYYIPMSDVKPGILIPRSRKTLCEWKGQAAYFDVSAGGRTVTAAAWTYPDPVDAFAVLKDMVAFYPAQMDACFVDGERARPQEGGFYGGWITSDLAGPFKGPPGTEFW